MRDHTQRLAELLKLGWTCEHPASIHHPIGHDKVSRRSVYLEGQINGAPREAFLSISDGVVMLIRGEDFTFAHFIDLLEGRLRLPVESLKDDRQKGLFDEH